MILKTWTWTEKDRRLLHFVGGLFAEYNSMTIQRAFEAFSERNHKARHYYKDLFEMSDEEYDEFWEKILYVPPREESQ